MTATLHPISPTTTTTTQGVTPEIIDSYQQKYDDEHIITLKLSAQLKALEEDSKNRIESLKAEISNYKKLL